VTQIQGLTANAAGSADSAAASVINQANAMGQETTFLQLLVAQIQNQDPTQPIDSTAFITQLAQFSQLEQLIGIRQTVQQLVPPATSGATTGN
jgi:flagellar basal-body rod modification protein FlgD